jgi:Zn-dependent peptidase ImmA (M78 family)
MNPGRRRFTIAHEIGHYVLHSGEGLQRDDRAGNFTGWNDASEEAEANLFAAELLMQKFLFKPRILGTVPPLAFIDKLATAFSTSVMATAFQYVTWIAEQVALIVSVGAK